MQPMISVIVPVYNVEKYLKRCVYSVLNQSYNNLEIILVDDGSTDDSGLICDELGREDDRIIVIHQQNSGLSMARNRALDIAKGEYIAFVDSDDFIKEEMYQTLLDKMLFYEADMVMCGYTKWMEEEQRPVQPNIAYEEKVLAGEDVYELFFREENSILLPVAWNKLYKRKLWDEIRYPKGKYHEDEYVIHHLLHLCQRVVMIPDCFYNYSIRQNSIMTSRNLQASRDWIGALLDRKDFFQTWNLQTLFRKQQSFCIRMILWECKKRNSLSRENKAFIREMSKLIKKILAEIHETGKGFTNARLFACIPFLYIRCSNFVAILRHGE